jgi:hypothetical protein
MGHDKGVDEVDYAERAPTGRAAEPLDLARGCHEGTSKTVNKS